MYTTSFLKKIILIATVVLLYSCDKDYNSIGDGLIGDNNFDLLQYTSAVTAYNQKTDVVQSNNLAINALGIYDNPNFGETIASFNTQLTLATPISTTYIGAKPYVSSVVLTIPYYYDASKTTTSATDGSHEYTLDSIYGASKAPIKLSVYESGVYMPVKELVGGFESDKVFYNDQNTEFDGYKVSSRLNNDASVAQNDAFFFDPAEHVVVTKDSITKVETTTRTPPGMQLNLDKSYFKTKIIDGALAGKLENDNTFKEYFKGLYFKVEKSGASDGNMAMLNFKAGKITVNYNEDLSATTSGVTTVTRVKKSIVLNLTGNCVSLLNQTKTSAAYTTAMTTANPTLGDEKLFLKGGEGSVGVIELFDKKDVLGIDALGNLTTVPNGVSDELDQLRSQYLFKKLLINEANLVFHIDAATMAKNYEPQRIYLYNLSHNIPVLDYYTDASTSSDAKKSKYNFGGNITREAVTGGRGLTYKFRITNQIKNLIQHTDSTNVKLGVVVTEDIATSAFYKVKTPNAYFSKLPKASVMNPLGTILYGTNSSVPEDKKLKLEIIYTKPN